MKEEHFRGITEFIRSRPFLHNWTRMADRMCPYLIAAIYFSGGLVLFERGHYNDLLWYFGMPAFKFVLATLLRKILNFPRPYDVYHFNPIGPYEPGKGKSFPSRHTASAFAIARALWYVDKSFFAIGFLIACSVGMLRIMTGKHFPKDVLAAMIFVL